ncbi:MaoC family dehydratase [Tianweitania sediminis]|uniref:MaoC family dehydratase n=1 Tax=Tianweitania sediminis TaxID=1502156 RepID=A0A8J7R2G6_9HYPH|nr:MaoC family dehydratase [Tianweitania sediminis]MBP0440342.1 MaoC family dehydratase [Tianweitania sediminis]
MAKSSSGNFFEDFRLGQEIVHAVPRTITTGDTALYSALYGMRFPVQSSDAFAQSVGLERAPIDDLLLFHVIFGKTVPDISLNAVANLGYADCRMIRSAYPGDSFTARSKVIGLRENANGKTGIVYVRSTGFNQHGEEVLSYVRWVMVAKRDLAAPAPETFVPELPERVAPEALALPEGLAFSAYDRAVAGSPYFFDDYEVGERIDHIDGMTIEEAEHQIATRLYQNTAKGHFDERLQRESRFGRRIVYGGHVISLARSLSFNGLANAGFVAAINGGRHVNPAAGGNTIYCWSSVLEKYEQRADVGALRLRTIATKDLPCADFPQTGGPNESSILLDLDYWVLMPRATR